jgi:hypothetical protein
MIEEVPGDHRVTVAADKAYHTKDFVAETRQGRHTWREREISVNVRELD